MVRVLQEGFEYEGKIYRSLSAIAREVTGTKWNGFLFFGCAAKKGRYYGYGLFAPLFRREVAE